MSRCCTRRCQTAGALPLDLLGRERRTQRRRRPADPSVAGKFFDSDRADSVVASIELLRAEATRRAARLRRRSAARCAWTCPRRSIAAAKLARPGLSSGFASLPVRSTRLAATIGSPRRSFRISVRPFGERGRCRRGQLQRRAGPASASRSRHGSSALIDSAPAPAAACDAGGVGDLRRASAGCRPAPRAATHARRRRQLIAAQTSERGRRHRAIALDVLLQVIRRSQIVVVAVQAIGDAAEAARAAPRPPMMLVSIVLRARSISLGWPAAARNAASSSSIAFSSSSAVWPGRAVASIWKTDPRISECCCASRSARSASRRPASCAGGSIGRRRGWSPRCRRRRRRACRSASVIHAMMTRGSSTRVGAPPSGARR